MAFDRKAYLAAYNKSHYQNNKEKRKQQATEWYYANQEKAINNVLTYYKNNKKEIQEDRKEYNKQWRENNKDKIKNYGVINRDRYNELNNIYYHKTKHKKKHTQAWRNMLKRTLEYKGVQKNRSTFELLGYTSEQLKQRIEYQFTSKMDWSNYGTYWEIDHKKAVANFDKQTPVHIVNALCNLQPLPIQVNRQKSKKIWKSII
jgi:hypothetical protein